MTGKEKGLFSPPERPNPGQQKRHSRCPEPGRNGCGSVPVRLTEWQTESSMFYRVVCGPLVSEQGPEKEWPSQTG